MTLTVTSKILAKRISVPSPCQSQAKYWQRGSVCNHLDSHKQSTGKEDQCAITWSVTSKVPTKRISVPSPGQSQAKYWQRGSVCDYLVSHKQSTGKEDHPAYIKDSSETNKQVLGKEVYAFIRYLNFGTSLSSV